MKSINMLISTAILSVFSSVSLATPLMAHFTNNSGQSLEVTYKSSFRDKTGFNQDSQTLVLGKSTKDLTLPFEVPNKGSDYKFELDLSLIPSNDSLSKEKVFHLIISPKVNEHTADNSKYSVVHSFKREAPMELNVTINSNAVESQTKDVKKPELKQGAGFTVSVTKTQTWGEWFKSWFN